MHGDKFSRWSEHEHQGERDREAKDHGVLKQYRGTG